MPTRSLGQKPPHCEGASPSLAAVFKFIPDHHPKSKLNSEHAIEMRNSLGYIIRHVTPRGRAGVLGVHIRSFWIWDVYSPEGQFLGAETVFREALGVALKHYLSPSFTAPEIS